MTQGFGTMIKSEEKTGVLTAAFFSDKRVINIKGLKHL